jgi:hypothetical protein
MVSPLSKSVVVSPLRYDRRNNIAVADNILQLSRVKERGIAPAMCKEQQGESLFSAGNWSVIYDDGCR